MKTRLFLLPIALLLLAPTLAQDALRPGTAYSRTSKSFSGDLQLVANSTTDLNSMPVLFMLEGNGYKAVRLGADLEPAEELDLHQQTFDGVKWDAASSIAVDGTLHILFVSNGKKTADHGIGRLDTDGALAIRDFHRVATFEQLNKLDDRTTCRKTLPDLILFDNGANYDQGERITASPDGQHYLVNHYTAQGKGQKKFWFACLDRSFQKEWEGSVELPFEDANSDIHQIVLDNAGRILIVTYVFCGDPARTGDKLCHETHLTVLKDQGTKLKDLLLDKDFVSTARVMVKVDGRTLVALRYGALTGIAGTVLSIDTAMAKLKATPVVDQRVPAIRRAKLSTFGLPDDGSGKKPTGSRAAKVPDEVIELLPAWGGTLLIEGFRDQDMQVPFGDAMAIRTLHGAIRATWLDNTDSVRWQRTVDRAFMTTAGEAYGSAAFQLLPEGLLLAFNTTPGGIPAINTSYAEVTKSKEKPPVEKSTLKLALIPADGGEPKEKSIGSPEGDLTLCPMTMTRSRDGSKLWIKAYDRGSQHRFYEVAPMW
ncbi:MAG TPA: hypothetical protein PLH93_08700 [Flavobacteriales bacterium]|nr:hypothetical protein [Flavobacteriales bacterium]